MSVRSLAAHALVLIVLTGQLALAPHVRADASAPPAAAPAAVEQPTKDQCLDSNGVGQELRRSGKLSQAREQLLLCSSPACPALVREDCTLRLDELEKAQPSIVFSVKNSASEDLSSVRITMDGKPFTDALDGAAVPVEIGERTFTFEADGYQPATRTLLLREGEKLRRVDVELSAKSEEAAGALSARGADPAAVEVPPPQVQAREEAAQSQLPRTAKLVSLVTGGVGVGLIAGGAVFGLLASARWSEAKRECPTRMECSPSAMRAHDRAADHAKLSSVGFIAGGVLAAVGVTLFFTSSRLDEPGVALTLGPHGAGLAGRY